MILPKRLLASPCTKESPSNREYFPLIQFLQFLKDILALIFAFWQDNKVFSLEELSDPSVVKVFHALEKDTFSYLQSEPSLLEGGLLVRRTVFKGGKEGLQGEAGSSSLSLSLIHSSLGVSLAGLTQAGREILMEGCHPQISKFNLSLKELASKFLPPIDSKDSKGRLFSKKRPKKARKRGLWSGCQIVKTSVWGQMPGGCCRI